MKRLFLNLKLEFWLVLILTAVMLLLTQSQPVRALAPITRAQVGIEASTDKQNDNFTLPNAIYITPIFLEANDTSFVSDYDWYKGLYYYQAYRQSQGDFLFHYFVTKDGQLLQGNSKGPEQNFKLADTSDKAIIIAYFAKNADVDFEAPAKATISASILELANTYKIPLTKIYIKNIEFITQKDQPILGRMSLPGGHWESSLKDIIKQITPNYNPQARNYNLSVEKVELPSAGVNYGDNVVLNLTIKNNSVFNLYSGSDDEPIIAKTNAGASKFYVNDVWLSGTQAPIMQTNTYLKAGESKAFQIRLSVPLYFGVISENFQLANSLGKAYPNSTFAISLNVNRPSQRVIEITNTETGTLNVRSGPGGSYDVVQRVNPGQRFFVLEVSNSGWTKLDLANGKSGWVLSKYVKTV